MTHDEVRRLLSESASETLAGDAARGVEIHLAGCADCRDWRRTFELAALGARLGGADGDHPDGERLGRFVAEPESLAVAESERLREHLARCPACRAQARAVEQALAEAGPLPATAPARRVFRLPLAAALAGAALASLFWWSASERAAVLEGGQPVLWIGPLERGAVAEAPWPAGDAPSRFVALAPAAEAIAADERLRVELFDLARGTEHWAIELDGERSRRELAELGFVLVAIPAEALAGRSLRLRLVGIAPDGTARTLVERAIAPR